MTGSRITDMEHFFIAGINYKKTDASIRGQFAINPTQYESILQKATQSGIKELFILSTCNRTEIYGIAPKKEILIDLLCSETAGDVETFNKLAYVRNGIEAVRHLHFVGAGLDSQILGDYEIIGQLKQAFKFAKERNFIGSFIERLLNSVLQSSKSIKSNTELSSGTVSVSFATIQFLRNRVPHIENKKIVLIGTGKIGKNTCKYLVTLANPKNITVINRTCETASELANSLGIQHAPIEVLQAKVDEADIVLVSTNAETPILTKQHISSNSPKVLIDLSIPNNIEPSLKDFSFITLVNVDELSKQTDETLNKRETEVPKAQEIINQHIADFSVWYEMRRHVPVLKAVKEKLMTIHSDEIISENDAVAIQKVIKNMAVKLRSNNTRGCHYIEAINDYISTGTHA